MADRKKALCVVNEALLELIELLLEHMEIDVYVAKGEHECVSVARAERPDLAILDWNLRLFDGDVDGIMRRLEAGDILQDLPVIMLAPPVAGCYSFVLPPWHTHVQYLRKPFGPQEFEDAVCQALDMDRPES